MNQMALPRSLSFWTQSKTVAISIGLLVSLFASVDQARAIEWIENSSFPIQNSEALATAMTQTFSPTSENFGYANVPTSRGRKAPYSYGYILRKHTDLVIILPGVGGTHQSKMTLRLGEILRDRSGFHFLAVDSLFSQSFANLISPDPFVGLTRDDADAMYDWLERVIADFKRRTGAKVRNIHLVGYSLGALAVAHLKDVDDRKKSIGFDRVIMANPPIDLKYGIAVVDNFFLSSQQRSSAEMNPYLGFPYNVFEQKYEAENKIWGGMDKVIYHFIGQVFHEDLAGVLRLIGADPLYSKYATIKLSETFSRYVEAVLCPFVRDQRVQPGLPVGDLFDLADLRKLENLLARDPHIFLLHAKGDFLTRSTDWEWVDKTLGDRAKIFSYGGHLGYFLSEPGVSMIDRILKGI